MGRRGGIRRGGRGGGEGGAGGSGGGGLARLLALSGFSAANFFQTAVGGGEAGIATGFGFAVFAQLTSLGASGRFLSRWDGAHGLDVDLSTGGANIRASVADGAAGPRTANLVTAASDVGKLLLIVGQYDGAGKLTAIQARGISSAVTFAAGFTPATASLASQLGFNGVALTTGRILAAKTWRGVPSQTQLEALFDAVRTLGDLPALFPLSPATDADIAALAPRHWYDGSAYTGGANLTALTNRGSAGGALNVAAGTIALPAADAAFNGQPVITFTQTQWLQSSLPASEFRFLHNGQGRDVFVVLANTDANASSRSNALLCTSSWNAGATQNGVSMYFRAAPSLDIVEEIQATNATPVVQDIPSVVMLPLNTPVFVESTYGSTASPNHALFSGPTAVMSKAQAVAPNAGDPAGTLRFGTDITAGASLNLHGKVALILAFDRVLSERERQTVRDFIRTKYTVGQITTTHRWSLKDALAGLGVIDGQLAPASLADTVTAAAIDRMDRQGSPIVRLISASGDGRKSYGLLGATATAYLEGGMLARTAATGYWFALWAIPWSIAANGQTYKWLIEFGSGSAACKIYVSNGSGLIVQGSNVNAPPLTLTGAHVGQPMLITGVMNGTTIEGFVNGVSTGAPVAATDPGAASLLRLGAALNGAAWGLDWSLFGYTIGRVAGGITAAEVADHYKACVAAGRIVPIAGKTEHYVDLTADIVDNGGPDNGIPAQVKDQIGTDHLTRVGGLKVTSKGGISEVSAAQFLRTASLTPLAGSAAGDLWVETLVDLEAGGIAPRAALSGSTTFNLTTGWGIQTWNNDAAPMVRFSIGDGTTFAAIYGDALLGRRHLAFRYAGATNTFDAFVDGVLVGTTTVVFSPNTTEPLMIGAVRASAPANTITKTGVRGVSGGTVSVSNAEIAAAAAAALSTGTVAGISGKTSHRWSVVDDIAEAGGRVPGVVRERVAGVDHVITVGSPLQVAQRTERLWSYEKNPILYGSGGHTATSNYAASNGGAGNTLAFGGTLVFRPSATSTSSLRVLVSALLLTPTRGFDIRTSGTNGTISAIVANAANAGTTSGAGSLAGLYGKTCIFSFQYDGTTGRLRAYLNRTEIGSGVVIAGHAPASGAITWGAELAGSTVPATDNDIFGLVLWDGLAGLSQIQAQHDAIQANDGRIQPMPSVSNTLMVDATADAQANGGALPLLEDRIGNNDFVKQGSPLVATQYARAFGF